MESIWETKRGVGLNLLLVPDPVKECNSIEQACIPNMVSMLAFHTPDAEIKGLKEFPPELRPPVQPTFWSFRLMVGLGTFFILTALLAVVLSYRGTLETNPFFLKILLFSIPLPYIANQLGWIVAEVGRQPWIVYGIMKTSDGVSKSIDMVQVVVSLVGFTLLYGALGVIDIYLLAKYAKKGPDDDLSVIIKTTRQEA
jgi:cytochrome d ubiquinol oxidase subunit I